MTHKSPVGATEIESNTSGRVANKGLEGLAITPDGRALVAALQSPLLQDGGTSGSVTRLVQIDLRTGETREFGYPLTNIGTLKKPKYTTVSDIVAVNDYQVLIDERDGAGLGDGSLATFKRLYLVDLSSAPDVGAVTGEASLVPLALGKALIVDLVATLGAAGIAPQDIPAKMSSEVVDDALALLRWVEVDVVGPSSCCASDTDRYPEPVTLAPAGERVRVAWLIAGVGGNHPDAEREERLSKRGEAEELAGARANASRSGPHSSVRDAQRRGPGVPTAIAVRSSRSRRAGSGATCDRASRWASSGRARSCG